MNATIDQTIAAELAASTLRRVARYSALYAAQIQEICVLDRRTLESAGILEAAQTLYMEAIQIAQEASAA